MLTQPLFWEWFQEVWHDLERARATPTKSLSLDRGCGSVTAERNVLHVVEAPLATRDPFKRRDLTYLEEFEPIGLPMARVQNYAESLGEELNVSGGKDVVDAVGSLGGKIHYESYSPAISGTIYVHGECDFDIVLPNHTSPLRDNFTVAHELGHYFLHSRQGEQRIIAKRVASGRIEWEANWFAAAFVMPEERFIAAVKDFNGNDEAVSFIFGVSTAAVTIRKRVVFGDG